MTRSHGSPASAAHDAAEAGNSRNSMAILDAPRADPFGRPVRSSTFGVGGLPGTVVAPEDLETQTTTFVSCIDEEGRGKHRPPLKAVRPLRNRSAKPYGYPEGPWACDPRWCVTFGRHAAPGRHDDAIFGASRREARI